MQYLQRQQGRCLQGAQSMQDVLRNEGYRLNQDFLASGGHPNELGHTHYAEMLCSWIKSKTHF